MRSRRPVNAIAAPLRWRFGLVAAALLFTVAPALAVEIGKPAPAFALSAIGGSAPVSLEQFKGKVVFVDFWASWCGPCRQSLPQYEKLREELAHEEFAIVAVNLDEDAADATAFLKQHPVNYTILRDPAGDVPKAFGLLGMPTSYLIDRDGIVRAVRTGFEPADIDKLRVEIHALLEKHTDAKS
jgi:thiol-disulfide isomerase/thioredoxin